METAELAVAKRIDDELAFKWLVPYTLRPRYRIIDSFNKMKIRVTHKHGVELPISVFHTKKLDEKNGNTLLMDSINMDMENIKVAFDVLEKRSQDSSLL